MVWPAFQYEQAEYYYDEDVTAMMHMSNDSELVIRLPLKCYPYHPLYKRLSIIDKVRNASRTQIIGDDKK